MPTDKHLFDLSKYPKHLKFFDPGNEKVIDKIKMRPEF